MTPHELTLYVEGANKRLEREMERLAWHAAQIINHRTPAMGEKRRRAITPDELLGRKKQVRFTSAEEFRSYMRRQQEAESA